MCVHELYDIPVHSISDGDSSVDVVNPVGQVLHSFLFQFRLSFWFWHLIRDLSFWVFLGVRNFLVFYFLRFCSHVVLLHPDPMFWCWALSNKRPISQRKYQILKQITNWRHYTDTKNDEKTKSRHPFACWNCSHFVIPESLIANYKWCECFLY